MFLQINKPEAGDPFFNNTAGGGGGSTRYSAEGVTMRHLMGTAAAGSGITTVNE